MKVLSQEKSKALALQRGWSLARAEGYVEGEMFRRRGLNPSTLARVGINDFWLGFRASYYEREALVSVAQTIDSPAVRETSY